MELTDHYAVRRGWNAARSKEFTVVSPAYTEFGFIMKINLPHRMNQGMNQWKKMRNCSMWVYKKKKKRKNEKKKKKE